MAVKPLLVPLLLLIASASFLLARLLTVLNPNRPKPPRTSRRDAHQPTHVLIVLGSGGHTAEMLAVLERSIHDQSLDWNDFRHRTWVVGAGDTLSASRAHDFERHVARLHEQRVGYKPRWSEGGPGTYDVHTVPRARRIHQGVLTTPASCLRCFIACVAVLCRYTGGPGQLDFPDVILVNGPATGTIMVLASVALRFGEAWGCQWRGKMRTVYVESWARVRRLSLSGRMLEFVVDRFLVQWPALERAGGRAEYVGVLV